MLRTGLVVAIALLFAGVVSAIPVDCTVGYGDVTALNAGGGCYLGPLVFSDFEVGGTGHQVGISNQSAVVGGNVNLLFTVNPSLGPFDVQLGYKVAGPTIGVDMALTFGGNSYGPTGVTITENVCGEDYGDLLSATCSDVLVPGGFYVASSKELFSNSRTYEGRNEVWIIKDISVGPESTLSHFVNSHEIPEPATLFLMGGGLLALGLVRRQARKRG